MAWTPNSANAELQAGMTPTPTTGHVNPFSHTLNATASSADQGLADTAERWNADGMSVASTPQSVLSAHSFDRSADGSDGQGFPPNGYLGSSDGMSTGTFNKTLTREMAGNDSSELP